MIQIHEHMGLGISCSTAMLPVGRKNWGECHENHSILCFPMLQKHKDELIERVVTKRDEKKNSTCISTLLKKSP